MKVVLINLSSDNLSYVNGAVAIPAYGTIEVPPGLWTRMYADISFLADLRNSNLVVSDGVTQYRYPDTERAVRDAIDRVEFSPVKKDFTYSSSQNNTVIWTPTSGKKFVVTDYTVNIRNNTLGAITLTIFDDTNTTGNILYKANFEAGTNYDNVCNFVTPFTSSGLNKSLKITTSGALLISGFIQGYETE